MASITIRNLDDNTKQRLRVRAAEHGRSMEDKDNQTIEQDKYGSNVPLNYDYDHNSINNEIPDEREEVKENTNKPKKIFKRIKRENN